MSSNARTLDSATASLQGLLSRADALSLSAGGVPASIAADIKALKVTMQAEAAAAAAAEKETVTLAASLKALAADNAKLRTEQAGLKQTLAKKRGWAIDERTTAAPPAVSVAEAPAAAPAADSGESQPKKSKNELKKQAKQEAKAAATAKAKAAGGKGGKGGKKGGKGGGKKGGKGGGAPEPDGPTTPPGPYTGPDGMTVSNVEQRVSGLIQGIVRAAFDLEISEKEVALQKVGLEKAAFGDYQCNAAMGLAKKTGSNPREVATKLVAGLVEQTAGLFVQPEVAGPGFINLKFTREFVNKELKSVLTDTARVAIAAKSMDGKTIVDFSSPNVAKEMHVGHLRSTIIGDTIKRHLEFLGHDVLGLNHVGDWGTQFGMLISYMREVAPEALADVDNVDLGDLVVFYKNAKKWFDTTEANQDVSRAEVVKLQGGDAQSLKLWKIIVANSAKAFNEIYDTLDVRGLELRGESFYNPMLKDTVDVLTAQGLTVDDDGATCVPLEGFFQRQTKEDAAAGKPQVPAKMIVQKREGGFLYATTDLAAVRHRTDTEKASRVIYCTDAGQALHFQQVFQIAERAGWGKTASLEHVPFGLVCGEDGGKLKTRSGETTKLSDLLDTAVIFAHAVMLQMYQAELEKVEEKGDAGDGDRKEWLKGRLSPYLPGGRLDKIVATLKQITSVNEGEPEWFEARDLLKALLAEGGDDWLEKEAGPAVGLGSVKFADLSMTRTNDYRFSYRRMVDFQGKSAPFMLYQFVRIKSIVRKFGGADVVETPNGGLELANANSCQFILVKPAERDLARHCLDFSRTLSEVEKTLLPHRTCDYMYDLSQLFSKFYSVCQVGNAETPEIKASRLALCVLVVNTLKVGFDLIGLKTLDVM